MKFAVVLFFALVVVGCWAQGGTEGAVNEAQNISKQVSDFEQKAVKGLLDLSYVSVRAATICLSKNVTDNIVKGLCNFVNTTERAKFEALNVLHMMYYNVSYTVPSFNLGNASNAVNETASNASQQLSQSLRFWEQQLNNLTDLTGQEFEKAFLRFLVIKEGAAIANAIPCAQSAARKDILDYCLSDIYSGALKMSEIRAYLCGKYNECQIELTPEEVSVALNAFNDASLGLGSTTPSGGVATATTIETATTVATATEVGTAGAAGTA
jgi:hypothetical protein